MIETSIAYVYWIRHKDHINMFDEGYIGVSKNCKKRWKRHQYEFNKTGHSNPHLGAAIAKYGWDNLIKEIVLVAEENYCYEIESKLRCFEQIGWNIAKGGIKPPVSKSKGLEYVSPLKGIAKETPWMIGRTPWNAGKTNCWSEEQKEKFMQGVSKPHSEEHIKKRQESRRATLIAKGKIKPVIINGIQYESTKNAAVILNIPEPTIKYWCYKKSTPGVKYKHITECRWV